MDRSDRIGPKHIEPLLLGIKDNSEPLLLGIKDNSYKGLCVPIKKGYTNINSKYKSTIIATWLDAWLDESRVGS